MIDLDKEKSYVLACSCGPDSMALFGMLLKDHYDFKVAFVNYHTRTNSDEEEDILSDYCQKNNIEFYKLDAHFDSKNDGNFEAWARNVRYDFFKEVALKTKADAVLIAHHRDDVLETYLMQKQRKTLLPYYGIKAKTIINHTVIIRPLIKMNKNDLLEYCIVNSIPYSIDYTNLTDDHERNIIRHKILEPMSQEDKDHLYQEMIDLNDERASEIKRADEITKNHRRIHIINLLAEPDIVQHFAIYNILNDAGHVLITNAWIDEIVKVAESDKSNVLIQINQDTLLVKEYEDLVIYKNEVFEFPGYEIKVEEPGVIHSKYFDCYFNMNTDNRNIHLADYPLTIRTFKNGDNYSFDGHNHEVRRLFIDWKMPQALRKYWPIFVDKNGVIIYIPRYSYDFKEPSTSNLRIHIDL